MFICKFCSKEYETTNRLKNHEFRCPKNLDRTYVNPRKGAVGMQTHSAETKLKLSLIAKQRGLGGYRENAGSSKKFKVTDSYGKEVTLQSTYELICSKILNEMGIKWCRPKAMKYNNRNYFADFYLPEYDIYLDPKNSYKAKLDFDKIERVKEQNNVKVFILEQAQLTKEFIKSLL